MKISLTHYVIAFLLLGNRTGYGQTIDKDYKDFDFVAGEKTIFEDNGTGLQNKTNSPWILDGGAASVIDWEGQKCISINEYYTKLIPVLYGMKTLPDSFSIEYDTWLDNGYDGNPGIEIQLLNEDKQIVITPNKHAMSVYFPDDGHETKDNPEAYFGESKFYDRWVHISIAQFNKQLTVYLDQYKMIDLPDCRLHTKSLYVSGNTSANMKILLKNFRIATVFPRQVAFQNNKFITHAIKFDVNKADLKPESITVIKSVADYLTKNKTDRLEIGGHTDSDGTPEYNIKLSQSRAEAVKNQLIALGVDASRLTTKGYGQSQPLDSHGTTQAKAANRRVEFTKL